MKSIRVERQFTDTSSNQIDRYEYRDYLAPEVLYARREFRAITSYSNKKTKKYEYIVELIGYTKKYKLADKGASLTALEKIKGMYEKDNEQKTDSLTSLLHAISLGSGSAFKPVANDPERSRDGNGKG